ncbi:pyrroline-5-carboxylate reductase [Abditibacterium utsteinense]|uniref:Pyrroline-5-carboxylate reductase n=1 Tax=Abditibacterium utsteinense TaxID=1960156 RepID=A0A2S8SVD8_9BACT|nr:pyrroline-5-carboxylate reductase [Abditibacterium utsteinense]PQV64757.1 pyrroline-5-carboxylate reductase [Abditibacterium utsteinense]
MSTLTFLGAGAMGEALTRGLLQAGTYAASDITLFDVDAARVDNLAASLGVHASHSVLDAARGADAILVAVKPQIIEKALEPLRDVISPTQTVISIAAGVSTSRLEACFSQDIPVVRVMPNTPALVGAAASAICGGTFAKPENIALAKNLFEAVGIALQTEEKLLDAVTGLSGSGPAYVFLFIEALADGGVRAGLSRDVALQLAAQTVMGSAQMLLETGKHPGVLKDQVASPGGTTIAGVHALESGGFRGVVMDAVMVAANRSKELG